MRLPLQITFRDMPPSKAIEAKIRERATKLDRFFDGIMACRVVVEAPHARHHKGKLYHVRVDLTVPNNELVVTRSHGEDHAHEDVYLAIRDAFRATQRQLEAYSRRLRGDVKAHEEAPEGRVVRVFREEGYGFIAAAAGYEVYFHKNSVVDGAFTKLDVGSGVRFHEEPGENGPQASTVIPVD
jgi:ribosomal subunit interface protein